MKRNKIYWLDGRTPCTIGELVNGGEDAIVYGHGTASGWSGVVSASRLLTHRGAYDDCPCALCSV